jgi:hypothetical protein
LLPAEHKFPYHQSYFAREPQIKPIYNVSREYYELLIFSSSTKVVSSYDFCSSFFRKFGISKKVLSKKSG